MASLYTSTLSHFYHFVILSLCIVNELRAQSDGDNLELRQRPASVAIGGSTSNCTDTSCAPAAPASSGVPTGTLVGIIIGLVVGIGLIGFAGWWFFVRDKDDWLIEQQRQQQQQPPPSRMESGGVGGWFTAQKDRLFGGGNPPPQQPQARVQTIGAPTGTAFPDRTFGGTVPAATTMPIAAAAAAPIVAAAPPRTTSRPNPFDAAQPPPSAPAALQDPAKVSMLERVKYFLSTPIPQRNPAWNASNRSQAPRKRIGGGQITKQFPKPVVLDISGPTNVVDELKPVDVHATDPQSSIELQTVRHKNSTSLDSEGTAVAVQPKLALRGNAAQAAPGGNGNGNGNGRQPAGGYGRLGGAFGASKRSSTGFYSKERSREDIGSSLATPASANRGRSSSFDSTKHKQPSDELLPSIDAQTFKDGSKTQLKPASSALDSFNPSKKKNPSQTSLYDPKTAQINPAVAGAINTAASKSRSSMYGPSSTVSWKKPSSGSGFMQRRSSGHLASRASMVSTEMPSSHSRKNNADLELAAEVFSEARRQPLAPTTRIPDSDDDDHDDEDDSEDGSSEYTSSGYTSDE